MARNGIALSTVPERVSILETKVDNLEEKIDDLKVDVKEMHDCLDQTRDLLAAQLKDMAKASGEQHGEIYKKIHDLEEFKQKWVYITAGAVAAMGWVTAHATTILSIFK